MWSGDVLDSCANLKYNFVYRLKFSKLYSQSFLFNQSLLIRKGTGVIFTNFANSVFLFLGWKISTKSFLLNITFENT